MPISRQHRGPDRRARDHHVDRAHLDLLHDVAFLAELVVREVVELDRVADAGLEVGLEALVPDVVRGVVVGRHRRREAQRDRRSGPRRSPGSRRARRAAAALPAWTRRRREIADMDRSPGVCSAATRSPLCIGLLYRSTSRRARPGFPGRFVYSTFWTCSRSCSIATFMSTEIARHLDRRRLRAERVGLAQQLLDQELEALADLAALVEQARDLVEVRAQARQLLGDVDPDRVGGRFVERALLDRLARHRLRARRRSSSASFQRSTKRCCCARRRPAPAARRRRRGAQVRRRARAGSPRAARLRAPAPPRRPLDARPAASSTASSACRAARRAATPLQRLVHRERACVRQLLADRGSRLRRGGRAARARLGTSPSALRRRRSGAARSCRA